MKKKIGIAVPIAFLVLLAALYGLYELTASRTYQVMGELVPRVEIKQKAVALTFDDGPTDHVDEVIAALAEAEVKATFYLTGREIEQLPDAAKKLVAAGHELGNHSYSHRRMVFKSPSFLREEIERTDELIRAAGYQGEITFRPPNGKKLIALPWILSQEDRTTVMWDVEPDSDPDVAATSDGIVAHVAQQVQPGSIILLHPWYESRETSRAAIQGVVETLRSQGYEFKTMSELLELK
ncbi:polysaccharide deacetylase family protein [Tumebacillus sp. DT12]|uniref:Polysaccharide deacetylase family protein n=1 Tax=Tumebacillus lacus TaxID=2995335 RepID=A0ABT3WYR4_9BACL|nr:polysaccharide deacetylase family protein [Tumebacillus lacus]MCX7569823.1 polysaccharide deacetylase family protein [Tumebacillus lacus]